MYLILLFIILLFIILLGILKCSYVEHYYTFFKPFDRNVKLMNTNKFIQKKLVFSTFPENVKILENILKFIIANTELINIGISIPSSITNCLEKLNMNKNEFTILPTPLIYLKTQNYKNIRSLININETSLYMMYNSSYYGSDVLKLSDFNKIHKNDNSKVLIGTLEGLSHDITIGVLNTQNNYITNYEIVKYNSFKKLQKDLKRPKNSIINIAIFVDSNPSKKLNDILINDYEDKIYIQELTLDIFDINNQTNFIYNEVSIKHLNPSFLYPNNKYKTLSFTNLLLTNRFISDKIVSIILKNIIENKEYINKYFKGSNISDMNLITSFNTLIPHRETHNILNNLKIIQNDM